VESYTRSLGGFERYLEGCGLTSLKQVTPKVIGDYQQGVMAESIAAESKALKLRPVKRLFEHLTGAHRLLINPAEGLVEIRRKRRRIGAVLSVAEVKLLLAQPDRTRPAGIRNRAIIQVLYATGIRSGELLSLSLYDVDLKAGELHVRAGKGGKGRVVPLGKRAAGDLTPYLRQVRPAHVREHPDQRALFVNQFGRRLSRVSVQGFLRTYRLAAGIAKPVSPHTFRRTCATHLLQRGADIRHIQALLGHQRLSTTQAYTQVVPMEVKATHKKTHPRL
jgi:integrase/recombinase XerD